VERWQEEKLMMQSVSDTLKSDIRKAITLGSAWLVLRAIEDEFKRDLDLNEGYRIISHASEHVGIEN
jgi:hypothetical protein